MTAATPEAEIERRRKISETLKITAWAKGLTIETSEKLRNLVAKGAETKRGRHRSPEAILKTAASLRRFYREHPERKTYLVESGRRLSQPNVHHSGHKKGEFHHSPETREKIRQLVVSNYKSRPQILDKIREARLRQVIPIKDTKCEKAMQQALTSLGIDYEKHYPLLNLLQPDIVLLHEKIVVFVDGCYWHCCPIHHPLPKSAAQWKNIHCDKKSNKALQEAGWVVLRFWEHEILQSPSSCALKVQKEVTNACTPVLDDDISRPATGVRLNAGLKA